MPKIPFNVDAYTAKLIGRENVSGLDGAILELVKNTYDADASVCFLYYEKSSDTLYLGDNGTGMTEEIILKHWMTIGSSSKSINFKTKKGRVQTGAKGIGRFALDRIADQCDLLTISKNEHLLWSVDWDSFKLGQKITDITASLDSTDISFEKFMEGIYNKDVIKLIKKTFVTTGTIFKLNNLRDTWDNEVVESIRNNLLTLIPPEFKEVYNIYLFEQNTKFEEAALLQDNGEFSFDYKIDFNVSLDGKVIVDIIRDEFNFGGDFDRIILEAGFDTRDKEYFKGSPISKEYTFSEILASKENVVNSIGTFKGTLYFSKITAAKADKEKYYYKEISGRPDLRDSFGGIRIYRDGFRVRPYGDPKMSAYDWLMLASRKNKSPAAISHETGSWRVNADQMHGSVYISRTNITLPDQANRQGIVETKEFKQLRDFLRNIIKLFEQDRQYVCRTLSKYYDKTHPTASIEAELKKKITEDSKSKNSTQSNPSSSYIPTSIEVSKVSVLIEKKDATIQELENEVKMLRVLATTGIVTNTYVHELKALTHKLNMKIIMAKESLELDHDDVAALKQINAANDIREAFTSWFRVTIESVRRDKRQMQEANMQLLLSKLVDAWKDSLKPKNITIHLADNDAVFKCFPYEIESIINNLIANSATAFDKAAYTEKSIYINVHQTNNGIVVSYNDNGPGLSPAYKKRPWLILESFESDKKNNMGDMIGTGMGMWIINRIVNEYNGSIDLSENTTRETGFYIKLHLNNK